MIRLEADLHPLQKLALQDFSYSRLSTYTACEMKYFYTYILKEPREFGAPASLGNIIHQALEYTLESGENLSLYDLLENYRESRPDFDPEEQIPEDLIEDGQEMLKEFYDRHKDEVFDIVAKEMPFSVVVGQGRFNGYIDLVWRDEHGNVKCCDFKAQPLDTPILTPSGWTKMGDITVGSEVIGSDGKATLVEYVYPQGVIPAFKISFNDGSSTVCSAEHLWTVTDLLGKTETKRLQELGKLQYGKQNRYYIPTVRPIQYAISSQHIIHPYIMGVLLGDGQFTSSSIKCHAEDGFIRDKVSGLLPESLKVMDDWGKSWRISSMTNKNIYKDYLRDIGLWGVGSPNKFIPNEYLYSSIENRLELLRGLMDTDGGCSTRTDFRTTSPFLRDGIIELIRSLGGTPTCSSYQAYRKDRGDKIYGRTCYVINVRLSDNPFSLPRKADHWKAPIRKIDRKIVSVEQLEDMPMQCIKVKNEDGLYVTNDFIVTHNSGKQEIAAKAVPEDLQLGLYALILQHMFPDQEGVYAELYYLRSGRRKGHLFSTDDLLQVESRLSSLVSEVLSKEYFKATQEESNCYWCDFSKNGTCPTGARRRKKSYY